jgi:hypothetical protein
MRKVVSGKQILASTTLAAALAVFGCTTNKMPGDGQPTSMPYNSPATSAPTNGTSGGTRPGTSGGIIPMISSGPASMTRASVDNYALVAGQAGFRGRILGPSFPGQADIGSSIAPTGQFQNPALVANPEVTVNRSSSSDATPVVIDDSGAGITMISSSGITSAATVGAVGTTGPGTVGTGTIGTGTIGTTAPLTVAGSGTTAANGSVVTGAIATVPVTMASAASTSPSQVVIGTPTPTQSSLGVPSPTFAANPATVVQPSSRTVGTTTAAATTAAAVTTPSTLKSRATGNLTIPGTSLRVTTTSNGTPMITNVRSK